MKASLTIPLLLALVCGAAGATGETVWPIDSARSQARFSIRTLWFTHARGEFDTIYGQLRRIDAQHDAVDAWIDARSLRMDDEEALAEARGPGFFDVSNHPRIHFISVPFPIEALSEGGVLDGTLDLRGQRRDVRFQLQPSACPARPLACPVRVTGTLSRSAFGMRAHRAWLSDRVSLEMNIVLGSP